MAHLIDGPTNGGVNVAKQRRETFEAEARRFAHLASVAKARGEAVLAQSYADQADALKAAAKRPPDERYTRVHDVLLKSLGGDRQRLRRGLDALEVELERKLEKRTRRGA